MISSLIALSKFAQRKQRLLLVTCFYLTILTSLALSQYTFAQAGKSKSIQQDKNFSIEQIIAHSQTASNCDYLHSYLYKLPSAAQIINMVKAQVTEDIKQYKTRTSFTEKHISLFVFLHRTSHCYLQSEQIVLKDHRFSWAELINRISKRQKNLFVSQQISLIWINFLKHHSSKLSSIFDIPFNPSDTPEGLTSPFIRHQGILLTPGQASMWRHCQKRFNKNKYGWKADLVAGFMSPAFQLVIFLKQHANLKKALEQFPVIGFGGHQKVIPDMRITLRHLGKGKYPQPWNLFYDTCSEFGIEKVYTDQKRLENVARFRGINNLYQEIFANPLIPKNIARDLPRALQTADFYPSPKGLKTILALSAQESTIQWNPKLNKQKKNLLRKRFNNILSKISQSIPSSVSSFLLSERHQKQFERLSKELHYLTDIGHDKIREYDFYLWSRQTYAFIDELTKEYKQMAKVGQWFFDLESLHSRLKKEPQTFGLWQININHLQEKIKSFKQLRRAFPEIYQKTNGKWIVNRSWLIDALSGRPQARLNRPRTLELIIHTHLKPHYENHMLGEGNDLMYFIAENMAGEMSTFRAAVQKELNEKMRSSLKTDGDLTYYLPYSTRIDWKKESQTYLKLKEFISDHQYYFSKPVDSNKLIRDLCQASSWDELNQLELYRKLLDEDSEIRIFPDIRSNLYNQTPLAYAKLVTRKSLLF